MESLILKAKYYLKLSLWVLSGYLGTTFSHQSPKKLTVLITYFNPLRMNKINHQIRNILKCSFVDRLIISNHNPEIHIGDKITIKDPRLVVLNQSVKQGCGFRWMVAYEFHPEYLLVIDDDFLLFPGQVAKLFGHLLAETDLPHGLSGMDCLPNGGFNFRDRENTTVDFLCEVYAITKNQLESYIKMLDEISSDKQILSIVNSMADFMLISRTGTSRPKIHNVGLLLRDETFKMKGVAVHKDQAFDEHVHEVLNFINNQNLTRSGMVN